MRLRFKPEAVAALVIAALCVAATAQAAYMPANVVNIDYNGVRDTESVGPTYVAGAVVPAGQGILPVPDSIGTVWNGVTIDSRGTVANDNQTINATGLLNSSGGTSPISVQITGVGGDNGWTGANTDACAKLVQDYAYAPNGGAITISGLSATTVDIFVYAPAWGTQPNVSFGAAAASASSPVTLGNSSGQYYEYDGVPVVNGQIQGSLGNSSVFSGISIAVVPEPGTLALLATGLAGLLWRKRRD